MSRLTNTTKNCGACKWLNVPAAKLTKGLETHKRYQFSVFPCLVPFTPPAFPTCFKVDIREDRWTCPSYGTECAFFERRVAANSYPAHRQGKE